MTYLEIVRLFGASGLKTAENASKMTTDAVEQGMLIQRQLVLLVIITYCDNSDWWMTIFETFGDLKN